MHSEVPSRGSLYFEYSSEAYLLSIWIIEYIGGIAVRVLSCKKQSPFL